jgi:N-formylglutamate amidohydrolase
MKNIKAAQIVSQAEGSKQTLSQIVVLHIPHSSRRVPAEDRRPLRLDDDALSNELLRMTDAYTDELFPMTPVEAGRVTFPVSRLICDVERFPSDEDEPMAARGMGVIYTRTSMGAVLRVASDAVERQSLLDRWYWPHHFKLERMVNDVAARSGGCLIVDCHSFPSVALPYEPDQAPHRADICIGTDAFHTPLPVRDAMVATAEYRVLKGNSRMAVARLGLAILGQKLSGDSFLHRRTTPRRRFSAFAPFLSSYPSRH